MYLSNKSEVILIACERGYSCDTKGNIYNPKGDKIGGGCSSSGYKIFSLRVGKKTHKISFHRFILYKKYGKKVFNKKLVGRHLNNNKLDNTWSNLELGTQSQNRLDMPRSMRVKSAKKATRVMQNKSRPKKQRYEIYKALLEGKSYNWIMKNLNVSSRGTLSYMKNNSSEFEEYKQSYKLHLQNLI